MRDIFKGVFHNVSIGTSGLSNLLNSNLDLVRSEINVVTFDLTEHGQLVRSKTTDSEANGTQTSNY